VISNFYYSFEIKKDETELILGIHQEDPNSLGGHLRSPTDVGLVIIEESEGSFYPYE
jgi:hypothetical protein